MKGIILAGGTGTRLYPLTKSVSKQLMPVYDKPMVYYPLSTLMLAGIRDILIITTPEDLPHFEQLLGDGSQWGISLSYAVQPSPDGLAQAFIIGAEFIGSSPVCLILGDNIFYGDRLPVTLKKCFTSKGATVLGYAVKEPDRYGVISFNSAGEILTIEEKPARPKSNFAITGMYFFDNDVVSIAKGVKPSPRGELEIISVLEHYLQNSLLKVELLGRGIAWLDTGTHASLLDAANYIKILEDRQGLKIACLEEIAYRMKYIDAERVLSLAEPLRQNDYGKYLVRMINE